ncbi:alanine racemase [Nocardia sp. Marseille-Q1738]
MGLEADVGSVSSVPSGPAVVAATDDDAVRSSTAHDSISATPMPAHLDPWERRLLDDPHLLGDIAFATGGPFHVMYPARVAHNIREFRAAFERAGVQGSIYYGKKANKAACVARACAENGAGVDVASIGELTAALAQGVRGDELMVTGPAKSDELLWLAARHGALLAVDDLGELDRLAALTSPTTPARVLLRVLPAASASRFGMTCDEIAEALTVFGARESIRLEGFSFHLSGYDAVARAEQAGELIARCLHARTLGHPASTVSIGGGFGVDYVPAEAAAAFSERVGRHWFHSGKSFDSYYPYHFAVPGAAMLAQILEHDDLARRLRDNAIRLAIEPGRALLAHAGCTVFRVQGSKTRHERGRPYRLLTVDGTSLSLSEQWFDSEYLPDPLLWPARPGTPTPTSVGAATCLDSDMLSWRRVPLARPAEVGDLLVYPNTAGYQMDSNESAFHELPIPPKVVLHDASDRRFRWTRDGS